MRWRRIKGTSCGLGLGAMLLAAGALGIPPQTIESAGRGDGKSVTHTVRLLTGESLQINKAVAGVPPSATIALVPVAAKVGSYPAGTTIVGNELRLNTGGVRAWLEFRLSDWDPNGDDVPPASGFQASIDSTGLLDSDLPGDQPDIAPPVIACTNDAAGNTLCRTTFGENFTACESGTCKAAYVDRNGTTRTDGWCFGDLCDVGDCDRSTADIRCVAIYAATMVRSDDGTTRHGATLVLDIPAGAEGKYTVNLKTDETFMWDNASPPVEIPTLVETGFIVRVFPPVIYVNAAAMGLNNGTSWANAFTSLQSALAAAEAGSEIWVARGTYKPAGSGGSRSATFQLETGVKIYGGFFGGESRRELRDPANNETILSGDLNANDVGFTNNAENSYHVVTGSGVDTTALLDGFTIIGGNANGAGADNSGGAMSNDGGSPTIHDCTFRGNSAVSSGGAIVTVNSGAPLLSNCSFVGNRASGGGALFMNVGGNPTLMNCSFLGNHATTTGGAIYNISESGESITNCAFSGNTADTNGGAVYFGCTSCTPTFKNCTFGGNSAVGSGGGLFVTNATCGVENSVLWGNTHGAGGVQAAQLGGGGTFTVNYSTIEGWTGGGTGNLSSDPDFVDTDGADNISGTADDDLSLQSGSSAIDAADTSALPVDTYDLDGDGNTTERISLDLAGNQRVLDDPLTVGTDVDMGAYEYVSDCDGNGIPDDCDIACGAADGPCDTPGCGLGADCNGNDILDACDIAGCDDLHPDYPACDDCNLNGRPDGCDLPPPHGTCTSGCSPNVNVPLDVPDDCVMPNAGADWSDDIWGLDDPVNPDYPDNEPGDGVPDLHVTIGGGFTLFLDVTVEVDSVRVLEGATLNVTDSNDSDLFIAPSSPPQTAGITPPPKLRLFKLNGALYLSNDRSVTVETDAFKVEPGGVVTLLPVATAGPGESTASINAAEVTVVGASCDSLKDGAEINLVESMNLESSGPIILDGSASVCEGGCTPPQQVAGQVAGITPPPKLRLRGNVTAVCVNDFKMVGAVDVLVDSTQAMQLGDDFDNQAIVPHLFDWTLGKLELNGTGDQTFEVGGINLGQTDDGFLTDVDAISDTCQHSNYSMGTVEVASTANVTFANRFANTVSTGCGEALYVHDLIFQSGATVTIDNCKVYFETFTHNGVTPTLIGCGELIYLDSQMIDSNSDPLSPNRTGRSLKFQVDALAAMTATGSGVQTAIKVTPVSLQRPEPRNLPQYPPPNFSTYDTMVNGVCSGGTHPGHRCDADADCPSGTCGSLVGCTAVGETNSCARWVGKPGTFLESQDNPGIGNYRAARLQCTPFYYDWVTETGTNSITVVGAEIAPSSEYSVQVYASLCKGVEAGCGYVSVPVTMRTRRSGDVEAPFNPPATSAQPNAVDVTQMVNKFKNVAGALPKATAQLQPNFPELNADLSALDIVAVVDAVKEFAYAFGGPCPCPSQVTCGATPCATPTVCVTTYGVGALCVKTCTGGDNVGEPCINNTHCPGGACGAGSCRDRCGRCKP